MSRSPFLGMDPYLEQAWRDVHHKLCTYACDDIQAQLGGGLFARVDERLVVEQPIRLRSVSGDVQVINRAASQRVQTMIQPAGIELAEPLTVSFDEATTEGFVEIIDARSGGKVVTVIEFQSMSNKLPGVGREIYEQKRTELYAGGVSVVEINLLRVGSFLGPFPQQWLKPDDRTPYYAIVYRGWAGGACHYYRMPLAERLPAIAIPLRETDPAVALDIQSLIDRVYRNGAYDQEINYSDEPAPALEAPVGEWADQLLKTSRLR